jgi:chromosome segregation ATPase
MNENIEKLQEVLDGAYSEEMKDLARAANAEVERLQRRSEDDQQVIETMCRERNGLQTEVERLRAELHQAKAEWFEEKKRARELEAEVEKLQEHAERLGTDLFAARQAVLSEGLEVERLREQNAGQVKLLEAAQQDRERLRAERDAGRKTWLMAARDWDDEVKKLLNELTLTQEELMKEQANAERLRDDVREGLLLVAYHPSTAMRGVRDWRWEAEGMRTIALEALRRNQ